MKAKNEIERWLKDEKFMAFANKRAKEEFFNSENNYHDVVIFKQVFANVEVALFHFLLRFFHPSLERMKGVDLLIIDGLRYHLHPTHMCLEETLAAIAAVLPRRADC